MTIRGYLFEAPVAHEQADRFHTNMGVPFAREEGHEVLTKCAIGPWKDIPPLPLLAGDREALRYGVTKPDTGGKVSAGRFPEWLTTGLPRALKVEPISGGALYTMIFHTNPPDTQAAHALKQTRGEPVGTTLAAIKGYMTQLYERAKAAPSRRDALVAIGEALHVIQDSFSFAHTERVRGQRTDGGDTIRLVRWFWSPYAALVANTGNWLSTMRSPWSRLKQMTFVKSLVDNASFGKGDHNPLSDPRDEIRWPGANGKKNAGELKDESVRTIHVSREYLDMMIPHLNPPGKPWIAGEHWRFLEKWFSEAS